VDKTTVLKIDKDCHVHKLLEQEYVRQSIEILSKHNVRVLWIKASRTGKGSHYYIRIHPPAEATKANCLQYLLGDDAKRVSLNRARINSGLEDWNLLFESVGRILRILYCDESVSNQRSVWIDQLYSRQLSRRNHVTARI
jgi:hypothetical protein